MKKEEKTKKTSILSLVFGLALLLVVPMAFAQSSGNFVADVNNADCKLDNSNGNITGGIPFTDFPWTTKIKVPNGSGTSLIIRPSFATGIFTRTKIDADNTVATAYAGIQVCVSIDQGKINGVEGKPVCVWYDKRWQRLESNIFTQITGGFIDLILSTLSAHSYDYVAHDIPGGDRTVTVNVTFEDSDNTGGNAVACVGPGTVTVTQTKVFSSSDGIDLTP